MTISRNPDVADAILKVLDSSRGHYLVHLDVSTTSLTPAGIRGLANHLDKSQRFEYINLARNRVDRKGAQIIASAMANTIYNLKHVDVSLCGIPEKGLNAICEAIGTSRILNAVYLGGNIIRKKTATILAKSLNTANQLRELGIRDCRMVGQSLEPILKACAFMPKLSILEIGMNPDINRDKPQAQLKALLTTSAELSVLNLINSSLTKTSISNISMGVKRSKVKKLFLDANPLGNQLHELGEAIAASHVTVLSMRGCELKTKYVEDFFAGLGEKKVPLAQVLLARNPALEPGKLARLLKYHERTQVLFKD